jgi:flagellar biosynthesis protein
MAKPDDKNSDQPSPDRRQLAVAVHHETGSDKAPTVVASGQGAIAEQILNLAFANGIPVREDADLAEILAAVEIEAELPVECWAAIAEVLAYVYRANGQWSEILAATRERQAAMENGMAEC